MYTIAIANEKGGVAKTTTTTSLGACLAQLGHRVLVIDLDPQANLSLALGMESANISSTVADILISQTNPNAIVHHTSLNNLDLIPANYQIGLADRYLPVQSSYEYKLQKYLQQYIDVYDFVILDCPPHLGAVTTIALTAADLLLIPTQVEYFSVYALRNLMDLVRKIRHQTNPRLMYRLLITMYDRRNKIHRILNEHLHESFNSGLMNTIIETDTKLRESQIAGKPIIYHSPKSRSSSQYQALAQEILEYVQETTAQPA
jgi:chromosome partitioning protein